MMLFRIGRGLLKLQRKKGNKMKLYNLFDKLYVYLFVPLIMILFFIGYFFSIYMFLTS